MRSPTKDLRTEQVVTLSHDLSQKKVSMNSRDDLMKSLKVTAGCRFVAATRLSARDRRLTRVTALTSAYVILLTIFPYFFKLPPHISDLLNLITVALSVIILVSSLLQYSSGDVVNAEQHHRSGLEINEQRRILETTPEDTDLERIRQIAADYGSILQKYSINHDSLDYQKYQLSRPEAFPWLTRFDRTVISAKIALIDHSSTIILVTITLSIFSFLIFYVYPNRIS